MSPDPRYRRILLKISGEAFCKEGEQGLDVGAVMAIAAEIRSVHQLGVQVAVVNGGGNILRGAELSMLGVHRATADYMGMLGTLINAMALQDALERIGTDVRVLSALAIHEVCEPFIRRRAIRHLEKGRVVLLAGGTGNPFMTTDTTAALRASELDAEVLLKATKVDGVYDRDPFKFPDATRFDQLSYLDILNRHIAVMDSTAISLCMDNQTPILVFNLRESGGIRRAVLGEPIGTLVGPAAAVPVG